MLIRSLTLALFAFALLACGGEPASDAKFSAEEIETQAKAWSSMMEGHDIVMPLMKPMYKASKELELLRDAAMVESTDFHPRAQETLKAIAAAEDGMMNWMTGIRDSPLDSVRARYADHAAVMSFIDSEKEKIDAVAEEMKSSLATAKALIAERE
ncbi:MAG: hypothetical protein AAF840_10985 [Bacteroidota bacterium]